MFHGEGQMVHGGAKCSTERVKCSPECQMFHGEGQMFHGGAKYSTDNV